MTHQYGSTSSVSTDASAIMMFEANKKSIGIAYLLWFVLGGLGGHRFYVGKVGSAVGQILLSLVGWATLVVGVGAFLLLGLIIWVLIDAFLIPGWISALNSSLAMQMGYKSPSSSASRASHEPTMDFSNVDRLIARQLAENARPKPSQASVSPQAPAPGFGKRGRS